MRVIAKCCHPGLENNVKCCQTVRTEIETRSSRADRTNFGSEDIEWFLFCWHRNPCRLMRKCFLLYAVFSIDSPDHGWHQPDVFFESTSRYRFLRDLHTFGHPNKSRSLGKIGKVACSWLLRPAHRNVSLLYPRCETPPKVKELRYIVFYRGVLLLTLLVLYKLKSKSLCCPVSSPFRCPWHHFVRWTVVLLDATWDQKIWAVSKHEIGPHACHCEMLPSRVGKRDHHMWNVVKP